MQPTQTSGTVEMVSVEWLLQNIDVSVDGCNAYDEEYNEVIDWSEVISYKLDGSFERVVATIMARGFRVPICLYRTYSGRLGLGNGHHRMTASILLCLDEIPVYWSATADYMHSDTTDTEEPLYVEGTPYFGLTEFVRSVMFEN